MKPLLHSTPNDDDSSEDRRGRRRCIASVYGGLCLFLLFVGFSVDLVAGRTVIGRPGAFITGIDLAGALLCATDMMYMPFLLGPFGIPAVTLAFLIVADRRARVLKRPSSLMADGNDDVLSKPGPTAAEGWMIMLRVAAVVVGIALALWVFRIFANSEEMFSTVYWLVHLAILVTALVLAVRLSGLLGSPRAHRPLDGGFVAQSGSRRDGAWLGKFSLWTSLTGLVVPVAGIVLVLSTCDWEGRMGGPKGAAMPLIYFFLGLFAIAHPVALCSGLVARGTATGITAVFVSGILTLTLAGAGVFLGLLKFGLI